MKIIYYALIVILLLIIGMGYIAWKLYSNETNNSCPMSVIYANVNDDKVTFTLLKSSFKDVRSNVNIGNNFVMWNNPTITKMLAGKTLVDVKQGALDPGGNPTISGTLSGMKVAQQYGMSYGFLTNA